MHLTETTITIPTLDKHIIYGTHIYPEQKQSALIIFVHGIMGSQHEQHYIRAPFYFCKRGFDIFRFDQYSRGDKARQLSECSITIHSQDLNEIIKYFKPQYEKIYIVGHSLGALVTLKADLDDVEKIILLDPSRGMRNIEEKGIIYDEEKDYYVAKKGIEILLGEEMIKEWREASDLQPYIEKIKQPCKFIFAGNCDFKEGWLPLIGDMEHVIIASAGHCFFEIGTTKQMFKEIYSFLK